MKDTKDDPYTLVSESLIEEEEGYSCGKLRLKSFIPRSRSGPSNNAERGLDDTGFDVNLV